MKKCNSIIIFIFISLSVLIFCFNIAFSQTNLDINRFNSFKGTIDGKYKIRMLLYPDDKNQIIGNYFYGQFQNKIGLKGYYRNNEITLFETDKSGNEVGKFEGKIIDDYCNVEGIWSDLRNSKQYTFKLDLLGTFPGSPNNIYIDAGAKSTEEVENFAISLKRDILNKDKLRVSEKVLYPINVEINNKKVKVNNKKEFVMNFNRIFYPDFLDSIKNCYPLDMSSSYKGIMFGDHGQIWLGYIEKDNADFELKIIAINNSKKGAWTLK